MLPFYTDKSNQFAENINLVTVHDLTCSQIGRKVGWLFYPSPMKLLCKSCIVYLVCLCLCDINPSLLSWNNSVWMLQQLLQKKEWFRSSQNASSSCRHKCCYVAIKLQRASFSRLPPSLNIFIKSRSSSLYFMLSLLSPLLCFTWIFIIFAALGRVPLRSVWDCNLSCPIKSWCHIAAFKNGSLMLMSKYFLQRKISLDFIRDHSNTVS